MRMCLVAFGIVACSAPATVKPSSSASPPAPTAASAAGAGAAVDRGLQPPAPTLRLPCNFLRTGYAATLAVDPRLAGFDGTLAITGEVAQRSSVIWLHGHGLTIKRASASRSGSEIAITAKPHGDELLELRAASPLAPGTW